MLIMTLHWSGDPKLWLLMTLCKPAVGAVAYSLARFGEGSGPIYLDQVNCVGTEASLGACDALNINTCSHREDAGVGCLGESLPQQSGSWRSRESVSSPY